MIKTGVLNRVRAGDITYNKMWVTRGAFGVVEPEQDGFYATSEYPTFESDPSRVLPEYLRYALTNEDFVEQARRTCSGTTSRARLHPDQFLGLSVFLPSLSIQRGVAAALRSIDVTIAHQDSVIVAATLAISVAVQEILGVELVEAACPMRTIGEVADFSGGHGFTPRDWAPAGLPIIRIQNLNGSQNFNYYGGQPEPEWIIEPGQLLFAWAGIRGSSFGPCLWPGPRGVLNQHIHRLEPRSTIDKQFLYWVLRFVTAEVEKHAHGFKSTLVHLRKGELTGWPIPLPTLARQREIACTLNSLAACRDAEQQVALCLRATRTTACSSLLREPS